MDKVYVLTLDIEVSTDGRPKNIVKTFLFKGESRANKWFNSLNKKIGNPEVLSWPQSLTSVISTDEYSASLTLHHQKVY